MNPSEFELKLQPSLLKPRLAMTAVTVRCDGMAGIRFCQPESLLRRSRHSPQHCQAWNSEAQRDHCPNEGVCTTVTQDLGSAARALPRKKENIFHTRESGNESKLPLWRKQLSDCRVGKSSSLPIGSNRQVLATMDAQAGPAPGSSRRRAQLASKTSPSRHSAWLRSAGSAPLRSRAKASWHLLVRQSSHRYQAARRHPRPLRRIRDGGNAPTGFQSSCTNGPSLCSRCGNTGR